VAGGACPDGHRVLLGLRPRRAAECVPTLTGDAPWRIVTWPRGLGNYDFLA